jgi:protease-4
VHTDGVGTTKFAGAFDITRPLDPAVGEVIQSVIDKGYRDFTGRVAQARHKPVAEVDAVGRGRVWSGAQGRERGLVDDFGGLGDAIADAARRAKLGKADAYRVNYIEKQATPFDQIFGRFMQGRAAAALFAHSDAARALFSDLLPARADDELRFVQQAMAPGPGMPVKALAYCFCGF